LVTIKKGDSDLLDLDALRVALSADQPSNIKIQRPGSRMSDKTLGYLPTADLGVGRASKRLVKLDVLAALL